MVVSVFGHDQEKESSESEEYILLTATNSDLVVENLKLYEKMVDSTSSWEIASKHTKSVTKQYPNHPSFKKQTSKPKSAKKGKSSDTSVSSHQDWRAFFANLDAKEAECLWVATEKVHGANFCFVYEVESQTTLPAKRSALLTSDDSFFGYRTAYESALPHVSDMCQRVLALKPCASRIYLFAELFGGRYPLNTTTKANNAIELVQTEILYCPDLRFYFFDIAVEVDGIKSYLNYIDTAAIWSAVGVLWAQPLLIGSFADVTNCPVEFATTIPPQLGLPTLPDNVAEGLVIKPLVEVEVALQGKKSKSGSNNNRAIVKRKSIRFREKVQEAAHAKVVHVSDRNHYQYCHAELFQMINKNRINAVRSKMGANIATAVLRESVWLDVLQSASEEEGLWSFWCQLSDQEQQRISGELKSEIEQLYQSIVNTAK